MQDVMFKCWAKAQIAKQQAKQGIKSFFSEEAGGADSLIIAIVLIVIVVAIAVVFREQIANWVTALFKSANEDVGGVMNDGGNNKVNTLTPP